MKRQRERSLQYEIMDGYVVLNYAGKEYTWVPPTRIPLNRFLSQDEYEYEVFHTKEGRSLFSVEDLRKNEHVFCQEINPLK